jgi:sulfonate transport system permease protein
MSELVSVSETAPRPGFGAAGPQSRGSAPARRGVARSRAWSLAGRVGARVGGVALLGAAWLALTGLGLVSSIDLPGPRKVGATAWQLIENGQLGDAMTASLLRVVVGLSIGVAAGVALALLAGLSRIGDGLIDPPLQMLRMLPVLALVPMFIIWLGIGETPKVGIIAFACTFPIYLNLHGGLRGADQKLVEAGRTLGLSRLAMVRHVILPGAMPSFLVGLRYAMGIAWLVLVVSEQVNASSGLGFLMMNAQEFLRTDIIVVCLVIYAALGILTDTFVRILEKRILVWRST